MGVRVRAPHKLCFWQEKVAKKAESVAKNAMEEMMEHQVVFENSYLQKPEEYGEVRAPLRRSAP